MQDQGLNGFLAGGGFLFILAAIVGADLLMLFGIGKFSESKGRGFWTGFLLALVLTPVFGLLIVALIPADQQVLAMRRMYPSHPPR